MPTPKTESTELSVGFGLLNQDPVNVSENDLGQLFGSSLSANKFREYKEEFLNQPRLYRQFYQLGIELSSRYPLFNGLNCITWSGPQQQAATTSASKDLIAANIPISVKNESNVVLNPSPYNLFVTIPSGQMPASHAENWYYTTDQLGIDKLYHFAKEHSGIALPDEYLAFEQTIHREQRKEFQRAIGQFTGGIKTEFKAMYEEMCHHVADISAQKFNDNYLAAASTNRRSSLLENLIKQFFRINSVAYFLVGLDRGKAFALWIPEITTWKKEWRLLEMVARPDLKKNQSVVNIELVIERKNPKELITMNYRVEIRWSHGKFCGNPEAKLYKDFAWGDVPFFTRMFSRDF